MITNHLVMLQFIFIMKIIFILKLLKIDIHNNK